MVSKTFICYGCWSFISFVLTYFKTRNTLKFFLLPCDWNAVVSGGNTHPANISHQQIGKEVSLKSTAWKAQCVTAYPPHLPLSSQREKNWPPLTLGKQPSLQGNAFRSECLSQSIYYLYLAVVLLTFKNCSHALHRQLCKYILMIFNYP